MLYFWTDKKEEEEEKEVAVEVKENKKESKMIYSIGLVLLLIPDP